MKRLSRIIFTVISMLLVVGLISDCGSTQASAGEIDLSQFTVAFSQDHNQIEWQQQCYKDIENAAREFGVNFTSTHANNSGEKQISDIEDLITLGVDAIIVNTYHADVIGNAVNHAVEAGIYVIVISSEIPGVNPTVYLTSDSIATGEFCANLILEKFPDGANYIHLTGREGSVVNAMRTKGFRDVIDPLDRYVLLAEAPAQYERSLALTAMEDLIGVHGDSIDFVYTNNDDMALGAIQALEAAGYNVNVDDGIYVISAADGLYDEVHDVIEAGKMESCYYPTFGREAVETAVELFKGNSVETYLVIPAPHVSKETVATFRAVK